MTRRILMMAGKIVRGSERKSIVRVKEAYGLCLAWWKLRVIIAAASGREIGWMERGE